ncbi:MAG TPA: triple tyrosine motif-containing protein, partial [Puia sp.]|nr:triple tyrosine motif-containing protein [Puia sp.]
QEGLQKISPSRQHFHGETLIEKSSGQPARYEVTTIDHSGTHLWIGTYGNGFFAKSLRYDSLHQYLLTHTGNDTWANFVWNIRQINEDTLWVGTQIGLFWYCLSSQKCGRLPMRPDKPTALDSVAITTQFYDDNGSVWMGMGKGKGLCRWDIEKKRFHYYPGNDPHAYPLRYPTHIAGDAHDGLWFVSDASPKLIHWSRKTDSFQVVSLPATLRDQLGNLSSIYCDDDSILWLGSVTSGLVRYNYSGGTATLYGHEQGLVNSHISSIYNDHHGRLWLATEGGLTCFYLSTGSFVNYSTKDGLPVTYPTSDFYFDIRDRRLYSGGHGSFFYFFPHLICSSATPPRTMITGLRTDGNNVMVQYAAIDLTDGHGTRYAYQLQGMDTGWIMVGHQRQINFSHLSPGSYTFMVHAAGADGEFSRQTASVSFRIPTPFLHSFGFYALLLLALGGLAWLSYSYRQKQRSRTRQIRSEISRNLHDEVGANLTNISLSSLRARQQLNNTKEVGQLLESIYQDSQTVSEAMRDIVWSIDPAIDTLGDALPRMLHYATRLLEANKIELHAEIPAAVEDIKLSMKQRRDVYLIFKESINNMAKHSNATQAFIQLASAANTLIMTISDNGSGFDAGAIRGGNGLRNMRERARNHGWQLEVQSGAKVGTTVTLHADIA